MGLAHKWELPQSRVVVTVGAFAVATALAVVALDTGTSVAGWLGHPSSSSSLSSRLPQ